MFAVVVRVVALEGARVRVASLGKVRLAVLAVRPGERVKQFQVIRLGHDVLFVILE